MVTQYSDVMDKWQRMSNLINQHSTLLKPNLAQEFKTLFISRLLAENILLFLLQYIGLTLTVLSSPIAPLSFASGTACAFIFLRGYSVLPGIWLGSFFAYYCSYHSITLACQCATWHALQAFLILWISHRYISPSLLFNRQSVFVKFIVCVAIVTSLISLLLHISSPIPWLQYWLANFNGILIFSLALIAWDAYFPETYLLNQLNKVFLGICYGGLFISILALFFINSSMLTMDLFLIIFLLLIFISQQYGWCGTLSGLFIFGLILNLAYYIDAPLLLNVSFIQAILFIETITSLLFAIKMIENS